MGTIVCWHGPAKSRSRDGESGRWGGGSKPKSLIDIYRIVAITSGPVCCMCMAMIDGTVHSRLYDGRLPLRRSPRAGTPSILWAKDRTVRLRHGRRARPPRTTARPRRALRRSALATGAAAFPSCCRRRHARLPAGACSCWSCCLARLVTRRCLSSDRRDPGQHLRCLRRLQQRRFLGAWPLPLRRRRSREGWDVPKCLVPESEPPSRTSCDGKFDDPP